MTKVFRLLLLALALGSVTAASAFAQQAGRAEVTAIRIEGRQLTATVAVLDDASNPVTTLSGSDFRIQIDGRDASVSNVQSGQNSALPIGLVLTVDTSGSMAGEAIAAARAALSPLTTSLQPADAATVITFAQQVTTVVPPTSDRAALGAAISGLQAAGNTALFAGAATAASAAADFTQPRRAVVLLSDGEDFGNASGGITRDQALQAARAGGVPFFVVGLGREVDQQFLTTLARDTGGQYFAASAPGELASLYARISNRLRQQYTLSLELPADLPPGDHRVTFTAAGVSASGTFTTVATTQPVRASLNGLPASLVVAATVRVVDAAPGQAVRFEVDGTTLQPQADGRSVRLDPYTFEPGRHALVARDASGSVLVEGAFEVPALLARLLEPFDLPNLAPGDLVRLSIEAQPGTTSVAYFLDGRELERDDAAPYEVIVPSEIDGSGKHELKVVATNAGGDFTHAYQFETAAGASNTPAVVALAAVALLLLTVLALGGRYALARIRQREPAPMAPADVGALASWVQGSRRVEGAPREETPAVPSTDALPWGVLRVIQGPDAGKTFELREETELVGRGKFCTVRLTDKSLEEAHFVLGRDGSLTPSTPTCVVEVDGVRVGRGPVPPGAAVRAGRSLLRLEGSQVPSE